MARVAWRRYGKGLRPVGINGDRFDYALATAISGVLLFGGDDFAMTDVAPV